MREEEEKKKVKNNNNKIKLLLIIEWNIMKIIDEQFFDDVIQIYITERRLIDFEYTGVGAVASRAQAAVRTRHIRCTKTRTTSNKLLPPK